MPFRLLTMAAVSTLVLAMAQMAAAQATKSADIVLRDITVVDGDSVQIGGQEWRLIGFDTPETGRAQCEGERRAGLFAQRRLEQLLASGARLQMEDSGQRDRYRRPLGVLRVDGRDVREIMI